MREHHPRGDAALGRPWVDPADPFPLAAGWGWGSGQGRAGVSPHPSLTAAGRQRRQHPLQRDHGGHAARAGLPQALGRQRYVSRPLAGGLGVGWEEEEEEEGGRSAWSVPVPLPISSETTWGWERGGSWCHHLDFGGDLHFFWRFLPNPEALGGGRSPGCLWLWWEWGGSGLCARLS